MTFQMRSSAEATSSGPTSRSVTDPMSTPRHGRSGSGRGANDLDGVVGLVFIDHVVHDGGCLGNGGSQPKAIDHRGEDAILQIASRVTFRPPLGEQAAGNAAEGLCCLSPGKAHEKTG